MTEERLKRCFLEGIQMGMAYMLMILVFALLILALMYVAPNNKTKMVCEPTIIMQNI